MVNFKNLTDFVMVFGSHSQEALDFISDEINQRKFKRYLAFQGEPNLDPEASSILVQNDRTDKEPKIRIAIDGGKFLTKEEVRRSRGSPCCSHISLTLHSSLPGRFSGPAIKSHYGKITENFILP